MKIQTFRRKLARFGYLILCVICVSAVYTVYLFTTQIVDVMPKRDSFRFYSTYDFIGNKQLQYLHKPINSPGGIRNTADGSHVKSQSEIVFAAQVTANVDRFFLQHSVSFAQSANDKTSNIHDYKDTHLSQKQMNAGDPGKDATSSVNSQSSRLVTLEEISKDFHYPEVGYRYFGMLKASQNIPNYKSAVEQNNYNISSSAPVTVANTAKTISFIKSSTKSHKIQSKLKTFKKLFKTTHPFHGALPPSPINETKNQSGDVRYLVYLCDWHYLCGGWGDRQKGITSVYLLSRLLNRQFKIVMSTPCDLSLFYKPNKVAWIPVSNELVSDSNITINALVNKNVKLVFTEGDFNLKYPQKVVYVRTNQDYFDFLVQNPIYSDWLKKWGGLYFRRSRFHWAWNDLMQPSQMLVFHLHHIVGTQFLIRKGLIPQSVGNKTSNSKTTIGNSTLICSHVRIGRNPTIPMDENLTSFNPAHLPKLHNFMLSKDTHGNAKFFVATDYDYIRSESKQFFGDRLLDHGGKILHIDRQRGDYKACAGFEVAIMDQLILSLCDILIMCKSGFSLLASFMSNSTGHVYIMKDGNIHHFKE